MGLFDGIFKEKPSTNVNNKELTEINNLNKKIAEKNLEIQKLEDELNYIKSSTLSPKQVHLMEKNLKSSREINASLEEKVNSLKRENSQLLEKVAKNNFSYNKIFENLIFNNFIYKLSIDIFFKTVKFQEVRNFLNNKNIIFIQDMKNLLFLNDLLKIKNGELAIQKYKKLQNGIVSWDIRMLLCKGEKVQKIYKGKRKFIAYLNDHDIEFMDDMTSFDFESLIVKGGFSKKSIEEFKELTEKYFEEFKIKNN